MPKSMVVVESPAKARTIERYLGKDYEVLACAGHIKDLPKRSLGVNIKQDFQPTYRIIPGKAEVVAELKKAARRVSSIYLATDPDREGEAICQHLAEELNGTRSVFRVVFNEITQNAIRIAFENPIQIDRHKVEAQQARRILDRLVGYKVSPLLWQKVRSGLSAGRVQSVALRMIVDREKEIRAFVPEEYWNFAAHLRAGQPPSFQAKAVKQAGKKFKISNQQEADQLLEELKSASFVVAKTQQKEKKRSPLPPFITSKLQQEAAHQLRFSVRKTMTLAQRLYTGVEVGEGDRVGLITYMRTDSTRVADTALQEARRYIQENFGSDYSPARPVRYRSRKSAQDAHEAIRPTSAFRTSESLRPYLQPDELSLYDLIWKRFIACQMNSAVFDESKILIRAAKTEFQAVGSILKFDGFLKVYQTGSADSPDQAEEDSLLPPVTVGEEFKVEEIRPEQKFTQPPKRYSEATLVKSLEEKGIGRPSTYAQIVSVIQDRDYVKKEDRRFAPSETGEVVIELLVNHFQEVFDYDYTARLEQELDGIESGKENWIQTLREFYLEFSKELKQARQEMKNLRAVAEPAGIQCERCGTEMVIKWGRFGKFIACSNYPECKNTQEIGDGEESSPPAETSCDQCGRPMVNKRGPYGTFLACSGYPECKHTRPLGRAESSDPTQDPPPHQPCPKCGSPLLLREGRYGRFVACSDYPKCRYTQRKGTGVTCPECKKGKMVQRRSRKGKIFYGCDSYPQCKSVLWRRPVPRQCPDCEAPYLLEFKTKKEGLLHQCNNEGCHFREQALEPVPAQD